ncbi:MAG: polymer-forming cytoskeletal protein [Bacteroidales bacterium]|nr:polymer-forming cytoskeletal protein [Bacteroidales bacterium]
MKQITNPKMEAPVNVNSVSRISAGTIIKGDIISPCDIRIDGEFEGKILCEGRVVIGETAIIKGNIVCTNLDLWGKTIGDLFVKDSLSLKAGSVIDGNLNIRKLYVELGSIFNGNCKMISEEEFERLTSSDTSDAE